jgi:hypothetical protein
MTHQAQCPEPARSYFLAFTTDHPVVAQVYHPEIGWRRWGVDQHISGNKVRKLRQHGYTAIALKAAGRTADFQLKEMFSEYVGMGGDFYRAYPECRKET